LPAQRNGKWQFPAAIAIVAALAANVVVCTATTTTAVTFELVAISC